MNKKYILYKIKMFLKILRGIMWKKIFYKDESCMVLFSWGNRGGKIMEIENRM